MATKRNMILRIQTPEGMRRIQVGGADTVNTLYEKVQSFLKLQTNGWSIYKDRGLNDELSKSSRKTLKGLQLNHGDVIYMKETGHFVSSSPTSMDDRPSSSQSTDSTTVQTEKEENTSKLDVVEDEIDVLLSHQSGLVKRDRHPLLCRHGKQGQCLNCAPLEPYNEDYLKSLKPPAKHLSFHAYLKKMKSGVAKGKYISLEDVNCKIKPGCTEHPPWPKGICTKCQPGAVMLNRQTYRHVDNIMFENPVIMDRFLNYWRKTGGQRIGILYGKYEKHENVPLAIRATVAAIYEPPQDSNKDRIQLLPNPQQESVDILASYFGLKQVGWIVTDLIPDTEKAGLVKHLRHAKTHFLSAQECMMAADYQNKHPNPSKESKTGRFGSKFVTVVVSGDEEQHIHYEGWQVSNQCMALVRDECLVPTVDDSALGYIKESSSEQFVPDVFYKVKDEYGNEVTKIGRPMPIEYFLIEVPAGFPMEPQSTFISSDPTNLFPIENRTQMLENQNFETLTQHLNRLKSSDVNLLEHFLDFHFLLFIMTNEFISIRHKMSDLCKALKQRDQMLFHQWLESDEWKTVETMVQTHAPMATDSPMDGSDAVPMETDNSVTITGWTCPHCTFINKNPTSDTCDMCTLPKS